MKKIISVDIDRNEILDFESHNISTSIYKTIYCDRTFIDLAEKKFKQKYDLDIDLSKNEWRTLREDARFVVCVYLEVEDPDGKIKD